MKQFLIKVVRQLKGWILVIRPHLLFGWLSKPYLLAYNTLQLSKWASKQDEKSILNDFYTAKRDYSKRYDLYQHVIDSQDLKEQSFDYFEFGVFGGSSFQWWLDNTTNKDSRYFGFDTFEGLPEAWGTFRKGEMTAEVPEVGDSRGEFIKGLFQDSVPVFLRNTEIDRNKRIILHLDADLFSSTLFALTTMAPYLKKGDILMFDEFNVPNHEFYAFKLFCDTYYIKTKLIGAVNNYYQVAFIIE